ncbi:hypothetical protein [Kytococcus sp. HMSC28H12]|uniref:hypothetical protein n=1 Tax=Kytococcus sp. HMSC28H12 TaxID=1581067 RepID=UPI00114D1F91|nr:hypothetical protein [Kytococcus sp. HMSC28H12]
MAVLMTACVVVSAAPAMAEGSWSSYWDDVSRFIQSRRAENKFNDRDLVVWADGCSWGDKKHHPYYDQYDLNRVRLQLVRDRPLWQGGDVKYGNIWYKCDDSVYREYNHGTVTAGDMFITLTDWNNGGQSWQRVDVHRLGLKY